METSREEGPENDPEREDEGDDGAKNEERKGAIEYKIDMDEAMHQLEVPWKKITQMENVYLLALNSKEEIEATVLKLQASTKVTWTVKQTRDFEPCSRKKTKKPVTLFRRQYGCHMSTRTRAKTKKLRHKKSRNINCPAQLVVCIKSFVTSSKVKPKFALFDKDFPCVFEFRHHHNHLVDVVDVLTTRPMGDDIKDAICKLLNKGHSCASAYHTLYTIKVEEFGDDYKTKMADRHHFPKRNDISTIFKTHGFRENYDRFLELPFNANNLEDILSSYQKKNGTIYKMSVKEEAIVVCVSTPLMQRALQQVSGVLFIDPSSEECKEYKCYFILTKSAAGALPIGCILSNKHEMTAFREGMKLFREMIEIQPAVVLTSGPILSELVAENVFPNSKILFSFYHTLSSAWKALYETRHEMARTRKESYYQLFREVIFANNEEGLVVARQVLAVECAQPKFLTYIDKMYENIQLWCLYYRQFMVSQSFDSNESEISFRLFRLIAKVALNRTRLFNLSQMTDFVCSAFERYYKSRILEIVLGKNSEVLREKYGRTDKALPAMEDIGHHQYLFTKAMPEVLDEYYQVDMITQLCTCGMGALGKHCDHVAEVLSKTEVFAPPLTIEQKAAAYFIATAVLMHKNTFLPDRDQNLMAEHEALCSNSGGSLETDEDASENERPPSVEVTKAKWMAYSNKIVKLMEKDPDKFLPAVNVHLDNVKKYSASVPLLLKGLYAGFPYMGDADKLPPLTIINNKQKPQGQPPPLVNARKTVEGLKEAASADCAWNSVGRTSDSSVDDRFFEERDPKRNMPIVEKEIDQQQTNKVDKEVLNREAATFGAALLNGQTINFTPHLEGNQSEIFEIQKGIFVDQAALSQLSRNEVAVLDEKKGFLIIPMATD